MNEDILKAGFIFVVVTTIVLLNMDVLVRNIKKVIVGKDKKKRN